MKSALTFEWRKSEEGKRLLLQPDRHPILCYSVRTNQYWLLGDPPAGSEHQIDYWTYIPLVPGPKLRMENLDFSNIIAVSYGNTPLTDLSSEQIVYDLFEISVELNKTVSLGIAKGFHLVVNMTSDHAEVLHNLTVFRKRTRVYE